MLRRAGWNGSPMIGQASASVIWRCPPSQGHVGKASCSRLEYAATAYTQVLQNALRTIKEGEVDLNDR